MSEWEYVPDDGDDPFHPQSLFGQKEDPEQLVLPGLPGGFLDYQINYRPARTLPL